MFEIFKFRKEKKKNICVFILENKSGLIIVEIKFKNRIKKLNVVPHAFELKNI